MDYKELVEIGLMTLEGAFDRIVDNWTIAKGGRMNLAQIAEMIDEVEAEWPEMGAFMHGFFFTPATDSVMEAAGEQLFIRRKSHETF